MDFKGRYITNIEDMEDRIRIIDGYAGMVVKLPIRRLKEQRMLLPIDGW
ncbi:MAG: hypothetical protein V1718_02775 [archaeon]